VNKLHSFQEKGVTQILVNETHTGDRSALIGDDMGLGKTIEAIVLDIARRKKHNCYYTAQTLVVTMTSVMSAWKKEYNKWAPGLDVVVIDRKNRGSFVAALKATNGNGLPAHQVFVCHWQVLRFLADDLKDVEWFKVIGDEIQNIKNRKAQQTQVFKKLKTYYKLGLSGTWADNRPDDAWSVLNWLWPRIWSSYWSFFNHHVIQKKHNEGVCLATDCDGYHRRAYTEIGGFADEHLIHQQMGDAYVRRTKEAVWEDIPDKTYDDRMVDLTDKQRSAYNAMEKDMLAWVGKHEDQPIAAPAVISQLVRLQQFAVAHGRMELRPVYMGQITRAQVEVAARHGKTLVEGSKWYEERQFLVLDEPSSKLDATMDLIEASSVQIVVFGQSKQAIHLLAARLDKAKIPHGVLTGDTKQADRDLYIDEFQSGKRRVFCSTIKAGGVGITLTAGTVCIFLDRAWSPSANKQAEDRLHRLGQKNAVLIITLVARGTIDRTRNDKIELKWTWLKSVLDPKKEVAA
jgi:SNF2 family DNA or RNA helicase